MLNKKIIPLMCLALIVAMASAAYAQQGKGRQGPADGAGLTAWCPLNLNLSTEQNAKIQDLHNAFFKDTIDLRSSIFKKEQEMDALMMDPATAAEKVQKLQEEISGLRAQMAQKSLQAQLDARKVLTPEQVKLLPPGCTMGFGPGGRGCGMAPGCGMGPGGGKGAAGGRGMGRGRGMGPGGM